MSVVRISAQPADEIYHNFSHKDYKSVCTCVRWQSGASGIRQEVDRKMVVATRIHSEAQTLTKVWRIMISSA